MENPRQEISFNDPKVLQLMETQLQHHPFLKDDIISTIDVETFEDINGSGVYIDEDTYPKLSKWFKDIKRIRSNWFLSKNKSKGDTFFTYIKTAEMKIREQRQKDEELRKQFPHLNVNNNSHLHYSENIQKKMKEYSMDIGIKFVKNINKDWNSIAKQLNLICQIYLPNSTQIKPVSDDKTNEIIAIIQTHTHSKNFDISYLERDIKQTIPSVESIQIIEIKELLDNKRVDNINNNNQSLKPNFVF